MSETSQVTVVVASRNRREELLASLARHRAPVVYVDNASEDGSAPAVREQLPHVDVVALPRNIGAVARTVGVRRARTPLVAFADDDSWWAPGSLAQAARTMTDHPRLGLVNARILVGPEERPDPICAEMAASPLPGEPGVPGARLLGFVACAAMVRRDAFLDAGGFDPVIRFPGEEQRLALDLAARGWVLSYLDDIVVHHHPSTRREARSERARGIARSHLLTAVMRLPWARVAGRARSALAAGRAERVGLVDAVGRLPAAVRAREQVPGHVVDLLDTLEDPVAAAAAQHRGGRG
ncbi:glycosyltransferase [Georgenia sp. 10Sc9-8]|uniref:Glycosyltransferase n=1 Tax=Georgenia halotolerans TaxID=3028317 RepID=A0ABT5U0T4_9MICO|nr:glycosyltransferase [Georgenia halotolerans]